VITVFQQAGDHSFPAGWRSQNSSRLGGGCIPAGKCVYSGTAWYAVSQQRENSFTATAGENRFLTQLICSNKET